MVLIFSHVRGLPQDSYWFVVLTLKSIEKYTNTNTVAFYYTLLFFQIVCQTLPIVPFTVFISSWKATEVGVFVGLFSAANTGTEAKHWRCCLMEFLVISPAFGPPVSKSKRFFFPQSLWICQARVEEWMVAGGTCGPLVHLLGFDLFWATCVREVNLEDEWRWMIDEWNCAIQTEAILFVANCFWNYCVLFPKSWTHSVGKAGGLIELSM